MIRQSIRWAILAILVTVAALWFLRLERDLVRYLVLAALLGLALEPAVTWLHENRDWRRGSATALLLVGTLLLLILFAVGMGALVAREAHLIVQRLPSYVDRLNAFTRDNFDTTVISPSQRAAAADATTRVMDYLSEHSQEALGRALSILSGIFTLFTIGLFTFYLTADGPKVRRALLSRLPPERQRRVLFAWETAVRKVGGYLYSRLLLAAINGAVLFIVLKIVGAPFALPLALFTGLVAEFIPIVGTYVAGVLPVVVVLAENGPYAAVVIVIEIVVYQQVENYFLSPRISAKTVELNAGVAFGAAIAGGAVGGFIGAFFALPIAATIQTFLSTYSTTYELVDSKLTGVEEAATTSAASSQPRRRRWRRGSKDDTPTDERQGS
jgi:predicted PurR-regulated permease PerM